MFWKIIGSGFGSGYSPVAPGTMGAAVGCGMLWAFQFYFPAYFSGPMAWVGLSVLILVFFFWGKIR
ncbi:MAG: hypothetical protein R2825_18665 [Saprospiraceae bacterium]